MSTSDLALIAVALTAYGLFSRRLAGSWLSAPLVFLAAGLLAGPEGFDLLDVDAGLSIIRTLAEVTLALVLFSDASSLDTRALRREQRIPERLLGIGLPISILVGTLVAWLAFGELLLAEALVLSVLLAPTDAALGQAVVTDERLPVAVRQGLNVESGLNDGICVPLLFAALALAELEAGAGSFGSVLTDLVEEVGIATVVGAVVGVAIAVLRQVSSERGWLDDQWARVLPFAATTLAYTITLELGGSGFIAAFVAGLAYGARTPATRGRAVELIEEVGGVLSAATFVLFSALLVGPALADLDAATVVYAVLSLTLVRMVPVALSLLGTGASVPTVSYVGWFGPRGLATIVFALTVVEESDIAGAVRIVEVATVTVALSIVAHGITAPALTSRYVARVGREGSGLADAT